MTEGKNEMNSGLVSEKRPWCKWAMRLNSLTNDVKTNQFDRLN